MKQALLYSIKAWLTIVVVTPLLVIVGISVFMRVKGDGEPLADDVGFFVACVIFGLGLSLVPFLIMWYAVYRFVYKSWPNRKTKTVLLLIALLVTTPCFVGYDLYKNNIDWYTLYLWLPYAAVTVISIWYYKLNPLHNVVEVSH
jgi:hypothetical protein